MTAYDIFRTLLPAVKARLDAGWFGVTSSTYRSGTYISYSMSCGGCGG